MAGVTPMPQSDTGRLSWPRGCPRAAPVPQASGHSAPGVGEEGHPTDQGYCSGYTAFSGV